MEQVLEMVLEDRGNPAHYVRRAHEEISVVIRAIVWLDEILEKVQRKHHVSVAEVRYVLSSRPQFRFVEKGHRRGENLYSAAGRTVAGRYLVVLFVYRKNESALIVTARDMTQAERRLYGKA